MFEKPSEEEFENKHLIIRVDDRSMKATKDGPVGLDSSTTCCTATLLPVAAFA